MSTEMAGPSRRYRFSNNGDNVEIRSFLILLSAVTAMLAFNACDEEEDDPTCADIFDTCDSNASCDELADGPQCVCDDGWSGDGLSCTDVDECATGSFACDSGVSSSGSGLAASADGVLWFAPGRVNSSIHTIDPNTGVGFEGPALSGGTHDNINSLVWIDGVLYGVDTIDAGSAESEQVLMTIDTGTGVITPLFPIPIGISGLATYVH